MALTAGTLSSPAQRTAAPRLPSERRGSLRPQPGGPRWRALLEARWRDRLQTLTELSLAFHDAAVPDDAGRPADPAVQRLMSRAVTARRALADTDDALSRLATGRFGRCEYCGAAISARSLRRVPELRYCPRCA